MDVTLQQLRMLREVANRTTIAAAASSLGFTPSAVSQQLAGLEKATGVAVLERVGRNVRLTDAGRELVHHANDLLAGVEVAQAALERVNNEVRGVLHVAVFESVASTLLPPLLARLAIRHPDLRLRTVETDPDDDAEELSTGHLDLAFSISYSHAPVASRDDLHRIPVLDDRFHLVVPGDDPIQGPVVALADVAAHPFIASPPTISCGRAVATACHAAGFEPDVVHQLDDYPTTLHLVAAGQGVALIPDLGLVQVPPGVRVLDLDPPLSRTIELVHRTASTGRPAIVAVVDTLIEVIAELDLAGAIGTTSALAAHR